MKVYLGEKKGNKYTTAVMTETDITAQHIVAKRLGLSDNMLYLYDDHIGECVDDTLAKAFAWDALEMADSYRATVKCDPRDTYDAEAGAQEACKKVKNNWRIATSKAIKRWQVAMLEKIMIANPETFKEAVDKVIKKHYDVKG